MSGYWEASLPAIGAAFDVGYAALGGVTALASVVAAAVEPGYGVLAERGHRRRLLAAGGLVFAAGMAVSAAAPAYAVWALGVVLAFLASGALVGMAQAALADRSQGDEHAAMSRWAVGGELGSLGGSALAWGVAALGLGWRSGYLVSAVVLVLAVRPIVRADAAPVTGRPDEDDEDDDGATGWRVWRDALRDRRLVATLVVLETANLGMDVLAVFVTLWVADGLGLGPATAAAAATVWSVAALAADALVARFALAGRRWLLVAGPVVQIVAVTALLVERDRAAVLALVAVIATARAGWYPSLLAALYGALPGRSGVAVSLSSAFALVGGVAPVLVGVVADRAGLRAALVLLLVGPVSVALYAVRPPIGGRTIRRPTP